MLELKVSEFLDKWLDKDAYVEDVYKYEIDGEDFWDALDKFLFSLKRKNEAKAYCVTHCGGFDSPGYSLFCACLSIVGVDGELYTFIVNQECR